MRRFITSAGLALAIAGCASPEPTTPQMVVSPALTTLPTDAPISLFPVGLKTSNDIVIARPDPRVKYRTSPDCHYVNYDGSCKHKKYVSYRIE